MLEFIKSNKNCFVGVDFGTSSVKVVELSYRDQQVFLDNYGIINLNQSEKVKRGSDKKDLSYEQKINIAIKSLISKMNLKSKSAYISIPGFNGLITIIELPEMKDDELEKAIQFEAHKYIPSSLDEVSMSWEIIDHGYNAEASLIKNPEKNIPNKKMRVLLVAALKKDIERFNNFLSGTKMHVDAIELETFSIVRALVGDDMGTFLIIDMGFLATNIILVEKGVVVVNRNIDAGGNEITSTISESMNISKQRADIFKKGSKDVLNSKESRLIIPVLEFVVSESKRIINAYQLKNKDAKIDGILLSGGTSKMKGLKEYFSSSLGMNVEMGNPWRRIAAKDDVLELAKKLGGSFTVALGLALRGAEEYKRK